MNQDEKNFNTSQKKTQVNRKNLENSGRAVSFDVEKNKDDEKSSSKRVFNNNHNENSDIYSSANSKKRRHDIHESDNDSKNGNNGNGINGKRVNTLSKRRKYSLWSLKITIVTLILTIFFSFIAELTATADNIVVAVLLLVFLILGNIVFDGIGVAVTACDLAPLVSMSSRKLYGAKTAVKLVRNAEKVANICCDVIGDIFGIISGACSITIVIKLLVLFNDPNQQILTIGLSSIVAALTVGGKALIKDVAIKNSKDLVMFVARIAAIFSKDERKNRKKNNNNINNHEK